MMFRKRLTAPLILLILFVFSQSFAQTLTYQSYPNDPLNARIYKLDNGLTVYMTVYKDSPRIQTYIAVRAGSKNDPSYATGLAHYLEHMLFKGTDKFGSKDWAKEKPLIEEIVKLYDVYKQTKGDDERKNIYHKIDSVSNLASQYAIANEYDKMLAAIGATGTNAYTSNEQTVYVNDIPSNQLEKWLTIEGERYRNPVMRLFHTELEVVYEEKNRSLDNGNSKAFESLLLGLFPTHQYGTQTTIGTIEHLKNPPLSDVIKYYNTYYVPNNMAICLSGDFDPDEAIKLIQAKFGSLPSKEVPEFKVAEEKPITSQVVKEVWGPDAAALFMGYRFDGANSKDADILQLMGNVLFNGNAGLIDLNLNQQQKVLTSYAGPTVLKDYSYLFLYGKPREGQSLDEVKDLLLSQVELLKQGKFSDDLIPSIITDLKLQEVKSFESNRNRAGAFVSSFILGEDWERSITLNDRLSKITKQDVIDFANKHLANNYVAVYKKTGEDKNVVKVVKPQITPVEVNRDAESEFVKNLIATPSPDVKPVFIDFKKDIQELKLQNKVPVFYLKNNENSTFNLEFITEIGTNNDRNLGLISYLEYLGTSTMTAEQIKEAFYKIGCSYSIGSSNNQVVYSLSGLSENFSKALELFTSIINDAKPDDAALQNLVSDILKSRKDAKLNKRSIISAMTQYGTYGPKSPFTNILSEAELKNLNAADLVNYLKTIPQYQYKMHYYGPESPDNVVSILNSKLKNEELKPVPAPVDYKELAESENTVYVVNYDMVQAEIQMLSKGADNYDKSLAPYITIFNDYFGGGMSSVVFQDMRESKALAYSVYSIYRQPRQLDEPYSVYAYIGTQADKLSEAMNGMNALLNDMPQNQSFFDASKDAVLKQIQSERITKNAILDYYESSLKKGLDYDIRQEIYNTVPGISLEQLKEFHDKYVKGKNFNIMVLGDKNKIDKSVLEKFGTVKYLSLEDIFGYGEVSN
ncbi:MAG: insulinase family protein [Bacteroidetes bacterium]|nr:insulinase family protein [Bacteroidota bacterium]